jgi:DNA-directed RNA polymerase subunit H (RpoH/RPB5)
VNGDGAATLRAIVGTCEEMLRDRGCEEVEHADDDDEHGLLLRGSRPDVWVFLCAEDRVGIKYARAVLERAAGRAIVISIDGPTPFTRKECEAHPIQFFRAIDVCVNITRHCLVPRHARATEADLPPGVAAEALPRILDTDRVVQYYDWPCGTIVRIRRVFGGHEPIDYLRIVTAA